MPTLRVTQEITAVRAWVVSHGGWPCRRLDGGLAVGFQSDICRGVSIGWDEFEVNFCAGRLALACDEAPGATRCFIGTLTEASAFALDAGSHGEPPHRPLPAAPRIPLG